MYCTLHFDTYVSLSLSLSLLSRFPSAAAGDLDYYRRILTPKQQETKVRLRFPPVASSASSSSAHAFTCHTLRLLFHTVHLAK